MIYNILSLVFVIMLSMATLLAVSYQFRTRAVANGILNLSGREFHDKLDSILKSADELSDEVLDHLEFLMDIAQKKDIHWQVLPLLRNMNAGTIAQAHNSSKNGLDQAIIGLRPELRKLIDELIVDWVEWIISQNVLTGMLIRLELRKLYLKRGQLKSGNTLIDKDFAFFTRTNLC